MKLTKLIRICLPLAIATAFAAPVYAQKTIERVQSGKQAIHTQPQPSYKPKPKPKGWSDKNSYVAPHVPQYEIIEYTPQTGGKVSYCYMGDNYFWGEEGKSQDYTMAAYYYQLGADEGDPAAQVNLGICYENGYGVDMNKQYAAYWYYQAACEGVSTAEFNMGNCYANGWGVDVDYDEAIAWYQRAHDHGHPKASKKIDRILRNR